VFCCWHFTFWCAIVCHCPYKWVFCLSTLSVSAYCIISCAYRTAVCYLDIFLFHVYLRLILHMLLTLFVPPGVWHILFDVIFYICTLCTIFPINNSTLLTDSDLINLLLFDKSYWLTYCTLCWFLKILMFLLKVRSHISPHGLRATSLILILINAKS